MRKPGNSPTAGPNECSAFSPSLVWWGLVTVLSSRDGRVPTVEQADLCNLRNSRWPRQSNDATLDVEMSFQAANSAVEAEWLSKALGDGNWGHVSGIVPSGFDAYVAVRHPAWRCDCTEENLPDLQSGYYCGRPVRWAEVAESDVPVVYGPFNGPASVQQSRPFTPCGSLAKNPRAHVGRTNQRRSTEDKRCRLGRRAGAAATV